MFISSERQKNMKNFQVLYERNDFTNAFKKMLKLMQTKDIFNNTSRKNFQL